MVTFKVSGDYKNTEKFFKRASKASNPIDILKKYGEAGVNALSSNTPVNTGKTAESWDYKITDTKNGIRIDWINSNAEQGVNIAVLIQYGHGTRNGGYVQGRDYINPSIRPIFDRISEDAWKEIVSK